MAFQNQQNKQTDSVNTRGYQFFNRDGFFGSTLIVGLWNQLITLKIHPAKEASKQTESSIYDYDKTINLVLPPEKAFTISKLCKERLIPAVLRGEECTFSVAINASSVLVLSTGLKLTGKMNPHIRICRNIKPETLVAEEHMPYFFNIGIVIPNYDGTNKENKPESYPSELVYFVESLDRLSFGLLGAEDHARRWINRKFNTERYLLLKALAKHINAPFYEGSGSKGGGRNSGPMPWGSPSTPSSSYAPNPGTEPTEVESISSLDDFM